MSESNDVLEKNALPQDITSFAQVEDAFLAKSELDSMSENLSIFSALAENIIYGPVENKQAALGGLVKEMVDRFGVEEQQENTSVTDNLVTDISSAAQVPDSLSFSKSDNGGLNFLGVFTNRYADSDGDVFTDEAHEFFVKQIEDGNAEYPELYLWHVPVPVGKSNMLYYDKDSGFMVVSGQTFADETFLVEKALESGQVLGMSHGAPMDSVKFNKAGHITEYISKEVSLLPVENAANGLTDFTVLEKAGSIESKLEKLKGFIGEDGVAYLERKLKELQNKTAIALKEKEADEQPVVEYVTKESFDSLVDAFNAFKLDVATQLVKVKQKAKAKPQSPVQVTVPDSVLKSQPEETVDVQATNWTGMFGTKE